MNDNTTNDSGILIADLEKRIAECEDRFLRLIREKLGIIVKSHQIDVLHKTILEACKKFNSLPEDYLQTLMTCDNDSPLLEHLVAGITVGETYFFRDAQQIQLLKEFILPSIIKNKIEQRNLSIRIWSAGCASGEEIYTIAILLQECLPNIDDWTLHLLGTDINTSSLKKAIAGNYSEWSMRSISDYFKKKYFTQNKKQYAISKKILDKVCFSYLNLNDDTYPSMLNGTNAQDLILCRNVLIYFDNNRIARLMQKLDASLVEGGYLLLGASDPINISNTNLVTKQHQGPLYLHSRTAKDKKKSIFTTPDKSPAPTIKIATQMTIHTHDTFHSSQTAESTQTLITTCLSEARWQDALHAINAYTGVSIKPAFLLSAKATSLANLGQLEQAVKLCQESLALESTNALTYFTLAMALSELNRHDEAEAALRKSIFIDYQFVIGHFQLGLLLLRSKHDEAGMKSLRNALAIATAKDPELFVTGLHGLKYGRLAEILKNEIEVHIASRIVSHV